MSKASEKFRATMDDIKKQMEPVMQQNDRNAALFYQGTISQKEYEQRCINAGFEPIEITGFYKYAP